MKTLEQLPDNVLLEQTLILPPTRQFLLKAVCYIEINVLEEDHYKFFEVDGYCYMAVLNSIHPGAYIIRNRDMVRGLTDDADAIGDYIKDFIDIFKNSNNVTVTEYEFGTYGFNSFRFTY